MGYVIVPWRVFQPSIFRCENVSFRECTPWKIYGWNLQPSPMKRKENDLNQTSREDMFQSYPIVKSYMAQSLQKGGCTYRGVFLKQYMITDVTVPFIFTLVYVLFLPRTLGKIPILTSIYFLKWVAKNHQLVKMFQSTTKFTNLSAYLFGPSCELF